MRLRNFYDDVETHFRGLQALGVDQETYSSIVVPVLMDKLPDSVRINMIRFGDSNHLEWDLEQMLDALGKEIEIRESHGSIFKSPSNLAHMQKTGTSVRTEQPKERITTASALFVKDGTERCVFCSSAEHKTEQCSQVVGAEERKKVLMKFARCFSCLNKGHKSFKCQKRVMCRFCQGKHHYLICSVGNCSNTVGQDRQLEGLKPTAPTPTLNPSAASWVGTTVSSSKQRVALQTALAAVEGKRKGKLRVLFDTGSQRTFVSMKAVKRLDLKPIREENLSIKVIGRSEAETALRKVFEIPLLPLCGGRKVSVEAFLINEISSIKNEHIERVSNDYPYLQNLVFSDCSSHEDYLEIDLLIGSDYLWQFHEGEVIRGGQEEPVAVKTSLGWVISGPLKGEQLNSISECNFVGYVSEPTSLSRRAKIELEDNLSRLWDLDTIGIREKDDVHMHTIDNIQFNGERYSVGLPWKVGHDPVPSNYGNALGRLKGQLKSLSKSPSILSEYDKIIREQVDKGIIEQVTAMDSNEILTSTKKQDWNHVASLDNPADLGSRGVNALYLKENELWWKGPVWLRKGQSNWPKDFKIVESNEVSEERKQTAIATTVITERKGISQVIDIDRYSSLGKLLRVTAFTQRFISNLMRKKKGKELILDRLLVSEIESAELMWIKEAQTTLKCNQDYPKCKEQLGIIEKEGILVCHGRLGNSELALVLSIQ